MSLNKLRLLFGYQALIYAFGLLIVCGVIPSWGRWYSPSPFHRQQTDAFLRGDLALSHDPADLTHDLCWSQGGVHQVWGLGIPVWQLPFETIARLTGLAPFPDRLALGLFMALVAYVVLWTFVGPSFLQDSKTANQGGGSRLHTLCGIGTALLILCFPPTINVLRYRMLIYEEVLVYGYFFGILLLCGVVTLARKAEWKRYWFLCALAGLGGFIRPTMELYGIITVTVLTVLMIRHLFRNDQILLPMNRPTPGPSEEGSMAGRARSRVPLLGGVRGGFNPRLLLGLFLFLSGGGLLFITNQLRFGSGWEFGHSLNLQDGDLLPSVYSTRFGYPFKDVPVIDAARELFGALFLVKNFNYFDWYVGDIFPGQLPVFRWREFGFSTFDVSYAVGIGLAFVLGIWRIWKGRRCKFQNLVAAEVTRLKTIEDQSLLTSAATSSIYPWIALWSLMAGLLVAAFYLRTPVIASRYTLDFSPAFVAALIFLWSCLLATSQAGRFQWKRVLWIVILLVWICLKIGTCRGILEPSGSLTREEMLQTIKFSSELVESPSSPDQHQLEVVAMKPTILFNGAGFDAATGKLKAAAIFFADNPEFVELEIVPDPENQLKAVHPESIRVKVGLEFLKLASIAPTNGGWLLHYTGPQRDCYRHNLQPIFLAAVPTEDLGQTVTNFSPWMLKKFTWQRPPPK